MPVVFFDSGLEYPETYQYIAELTTRWGLQLHTLHPRHCALDILAASGTWDHHATSTPTPDRHTTLITDPAAQAHTAHGRGELWGVRAQESRGRAALYATALRAGEARHCTDCCTSTDHPGKAQRRHHGGVVRRVDGTVAFGPIWDWKTTDVWAHIGRHDLPVNPVYTKLRHLGAPEHASRVSHMLDGNHLEQGRVLAVVADVRNRVALVEAADLAVTTWGRLDSVPSSTLLRLAHHFGDPGVAVVGPRVAGVVRSARPRWFERYDDERGPFPSSR